VSWQTFIERPAVGDHAVQVWSDDAELAGPVAGFVDAGFAAGAPAIVVATPEHGALLRQELARRGHDVDALEQEGAFTYRDAEETLAQLLDGDTPSPERFAETVGGLVDTVAARFPGSTIRTFGEMVDLLWQRRREDAALALETLWNELARTRPFALLCGYRLDIFDVEVEASALPRVLCPHSHARPVADPARLAVAVDQALGDVVGPMDAARIYLELAEQVPPGGLSRAQALLMWLSATDAPLARRLLDRARSRYALGAPTPSLAA
jgi:hypothetical protein